VPQAYRVLQDHKEQRDQDPLAPLDKKVPQDHVEQQVHKVIQVELLVQQEPQAQHF
jgi:hypothetical protein